MIYINYFRIAGGNKNMRCRDPTYHFLATRKHTIYSIERMRIEKWKIKLTE